MDRTALNRFRFQVFLFFDNNDSRTGAYLFSLYFMVLIVFSTLTFLLQTETSLSTTAFQLYQWNLIETFVVSQVPSIYFYFIFIFFYFIYHLSCCCLLFALFFCCLLFAILFIHLLFCLYFILFLFLF